MEYQNLFRDVASILAEKCINSESNRPFTISMLERTMKDLHVAVDPKRSAKQQALEVGLSKIDPYCLLKRRDIAVLTGVSSAGPAQAQIQAANPACPHATENAPAGC